MVSNRTKILIVDDEEANRRLLEKFLGDTYEARSVASGDACLELLKDFAPDIFLLDVSMPGGMDGFELCEKIRSQCAFSSNLIIFLSALDSLDDKIKGYKSGADDYITKPLELDILAMKLSQHQGKIEAATQSLDNAMSMAMTAMTNGSEIGQVNVFLEGLQNVKSYQALGELLIETCNMFGVNSVAQIRLQNININLSTTGTVNSFEEELMLMARHSARIYSFGSRCLFNFNDATLLVRVMPDDSEKAGRFRDHLASVMNGVESRMRSLEMEGKLKAQNDGLVLEALKGTHLSLDSIKSVFKKHDRLSKEIIDKLTSDLHLAFSYLDLNEEQEEHLMEVINKSMGNMMELSSTGQDLDQRFDHVVSSLEKVLRPVQE